MNIVLGLLVQIISTLYSVSIKLNSNYDNLVEIAGKGYKFNNSRLEKYYETERKKKRKNKKNIKKALDVIVTFIPILNLLEAYTYKIVSKRKMMKTEEFKNSLIPMTDKELDEFNQLDTRILKLMYTGAISTSLKQEEKNLFCKEDIDTTNIKKIYIRNAKLPELDYTLDEIKKLNNLLSINENGEKVTFKYILGKLDDNYTAIIGVPNLEDNSDENKQVIVNGKIMEILSDEQGGEYTFSVYPNVIVDEEKRNALNEEVNNIKQKRIENEVETNTEYNKGNLIYNESKHVLSKKYKPQNNKY